MAFVKFNARYQRDVAYLNVGRDNLSVSKKAIELLGDPQKVNIYYDKESNFIKLKESEYGQKVHKYPSQRFISAKLSLVMPIGRYYLDLEDKVFKFADET
jgi:hypothetical protein